MRKRTMNRTLAAALRAAGITDVLPVWAQAKQPLAKNASPSEIAKYIAGTMHLGGRPVPKPKLANPTPTTAYTAHASGRRAKRATPTAFVRVRLGEGNSVTHLNYSVARPRSDKRGFTHDCDIGEGPFTLSPTALTRLLEGDGALIRCGGTRVRATRV